MHDLRYDEQDQGPPTPDAVRLMGSGLDRVGVMLQTRRYAEAERELRRQLAADPNSGLLHTMLSYALSAQDKHVEATQEAQMAVGLEPDEPRAHHALASALLERDRPDEALAAISEALRLDPYDADYHSLKAAALLHRREWQAALDAADAGLAVDPEHDACRNIRAMALRQLGRRDEAEATIRDQLRNAPDDAFTHANQGWSALYASDHRRALEHFREALRLDPDLDYAREGILEALKAKNPIYRLLLRWKLWMGTLSGGRQWMVIIGLYVLYRVIRGVAQANPGLAPLLYPLIAAYILFVLMTWIGDPIFDSLLRFNRFGRLALTDDRRRSSNLLLGAIALIGTSTLVVAITGEWWWLAPVFLVALVTLPASKIWMVEPGWPRQVLAIYVLCLALVGALAGSLFAIQGGFREGEPLSPLVMGLFVLFLIGEFAGWLLVNSLAGVRPKR